MLNLYTDNSFWIGYLKAPSVGKPTKSEKNKEEFS